MNYLGLRTRTAYLRGEEDTGTEDVIDSHIQSAILDICNEYPFSWSSDDDTIADGDDLPTAINRKWGVVIIDSEGNRLTEISPTDQYSTDSTMVYWLSGGKFYTHSTETLYIFFYYLPTALSGDSDECLVPDAEAVAYLAAAKMYIGDERNAELKADYEKEASKRIDSMKIADQMYGPQLVEGSVLDYNSQITGG